MVQVVFIGMLRIRSIVAFLLFLGCGPFVEAC
jgi:hypothetical protein